MRSLDRKLVRDLWSIKGQVVAICMVIAAGVATFVMSLSTLESLSWCKDTYYERYRFAHVFTHVKRAPNSLAKRIASIPGVARVQTRITADVTLDVEEMLEPAVGRLISIPERRAPQLNDLHLRRGRYIAAGHTNEVLVSESFAVEHGLDPGDQMVAIINGRRQRLKIVGIALSPEYIIQIPPGNLMPDNRRFGVFWMGYDGLAAAFDLDGAFNDVALTLMHGASEPEVIRQLDRLTEKYGSVGAYGRADQVSHTYISDEIRQLRSMGLIAPVIFLSVAAFLLNIVLSRLINTQREQIAALKAFGYTKREIRRHYLKMILVIPTMGVLLGTGVGAWMGRGLTHLYSQFYRFPVAVFQLEYGVVVFALVLSVGAALIGTLAAVQRAVKLPPAEAMRPEPPATFRRTLVERLGLGRILPQAARMILRQMERHPLKSAISCLGIATGVAVLILGSFMLDSISYIMDFQFRLAQRQDLMITFVEPTSPNTLHDVKHLPGVLQCEPFRSVPARLHMGHRSRRVGIMGLPSKNRLFRLIDQHERVVNVPDDGLLLSSKLAELLDARVGDMITVEILEGERAERRIPVAALITEFSGTNAYMNLWALTRMLHEGPNLSGAFLTFDSRYEERLFQALKETPKIAGVSIKSAALRSFEDTVAENLLRMRTFNIIFASIIACGVVYNSARISLSERSRELATLRVIGFTREEISAILLGELAILTLFAIPLGMVMGYGFAAFAALGLDTELYRIPLVVESSTFGFAGVVIVVASVVSGLMVRRKLDHLDLVQVLKSKE
jgi:putative ABC transport system permease protein